MGEGMPPNKVSDIRRLGFVQRIVKSADRFHCNAVLSIQLKIKKHNEYRRISDRDIKVPWYHKQQARVASAMDLRKPSFF